MRDQPIYLKLPPHGLPSFPKATIARMNKEVNGVVCGPAAWRSTFAVPCHRAGFTAHRTSPCTFVMREPMWRSWNGVYFSTQQEAQRHDQKHGDHGKAEVEARDLKNLCNIEQLKQAVKFGKWETFEDEREYGGKTIKQNSDASIVLSMEKYVHRLSELEITREEKRNPEGEA
eukprot:1582551-Amphidinium_carterae.1